MSDDAIRAGFLELMDRCGVPYTAAAAMAGVSPTTIRFMVVGGVVPGRRAVRDALTRFLDTNRNARSRTDLRMP